MATGTAPCKADTAEGFIGEGTSERPAPPSKANPSIPPACEKIILKCLEKKREDRYQTIEELLQELEIQRKQGHVQGAWPRTKVWQRILIAAGLIFLLGIVAIKIISPGSRRSGRTSIAVMYAVNNSGDKSLNDLRWVIPYYMITDLTQSKYLSVLPHDRLLQLLSDMKQPNEERPLSRTLDRIADAAAVQYFVLPSFTKVGDNFLISFLVRKAKSDATVGEADSVKGKIPDDLLAMVEVLSLKVKSRLNFSPADISGDYNQKLAQISPSSLEAARYYIDAEKSYIEGDFNGSIQFLEKAIKEDPDYALAYLKMAINYGYLGEYDKKSLYLQKALTLVDHVSEKDRLVIQGYASTVLDKSPLQAMECYKKLIALDPKDQESYINLGVIWRNLEEWDLAIGQFEKTLVINPENSIALENKVYIYAAMGRYQEAVELNKAGIRTSVNNTFFLKNLPLLYLIQGQYDQASAELGRVLPPGPGKLDCLDLKGHLHHLTGDLAAARQLYEQLQHRGEGTPGEPDFNGRIWMARLYLLQGEYRQAQKGIIEGIELARKASRTYDELDFRLLLAYSELQLKRFPQAAEAVKQLLDLAQKTLDTGSQKLALHLSGLVSLRMGHNEDARKVGQQLRLLIEETNMPKHMRYYDHLVGQIALAEG